MAEIINPKESEHLKSTYSAQINNIAEYEMLPSEEQRTLLIDLTRDEDVGLDQIYCRNSDSRIEGRDIISESGSDILQCAYILSELGLSDGRKLMKAYDRMSPANQGISLSQLKTEARSLQRDMPQRALEAIEEGRQLSEQELDQMGDDLEDDTRSWDIKNYLLGLLYVESCLKHNAVLRPFIDESKIKTAKQEIEKILQARRERRERRRQRSQDK